jgi:hypothetical protein
MAAKRYSAIAADVERSLPVRGDFALETVPRVAEHYGVSYPTAWNAVQVLTSK